MGYLVFTPQGIICLKTPMTDEEKLQVKIFLVDGKDKDFIENWLMGRDFIIIQE